MNIIIFILSLLFIWVVAFSIFFILGIKRGDKKVAKIYVSKLPNNGFYKVGINIIVPYDDLIKLKEGRADIYLVNEVGPIRADDNFSITDNKDE